jgi:hypothetical protein
MKNLDKTRPSDDPEEFVNEFPSPVSSVSSVSRLS